MPLRKLLSIYVFCYFPFGFEGRMWDLIVSLPDHCLSFYFVCAPTEQHLVSPLEFHPGRRKKREYFSNNDRNDIDVKLHMLNYLGPVKRICVFEHSVMTNFNCACPAIQRGQGSGFLSEGSSWLTACMSEQRRFWRDCADAQARLNLRCSHRR